MLSKCYLCASKSHKIIHKGVRGGADINVLKCDSCGLVWLDKFVTDYDDNFYEESGMWKSDGIEEDILQTRIEAEPDDHRRFEFTKNYIQYKDVLDFGCGSGGYIKKSKPIVRSIRGVELEHEKRDYMTREGYEIYNSIEEIPMDQQFDVITLFHVLEHLPDPIEILVRLKKHLRKEGKIIIEVPNADDALLSLFDSRAFADFKADKSEHLKLLPQCILRHPASSDPP